MIISASRRTDIPAFYSDWFLNRLRQGFVLVRNPMNSRQISRVMLSPERVDCIVFWTKDPAPMLEHLSEIDALGYRYYFQFTLTPYGRQFEKNLREKEEIVKTFQTLSANIGPDRVVWRYDPIILNNEIGIGYHQEAFSRLCADLSGFASQCTISFVDVYSRLSAPVRNGLVRDISECEMEELACLFSETADHYGIKLNACCERTSQLRFGIAPASCIDKDRIEMLCGYPLSAGKDKNQRAGCGCIESIDIGAYDTCKNGCIYCYANKSESLAVKNFLLHDPSSELLTGMLFPQDNVTERKCSSLGDPQTKLTD